MAMANYSNMEDSNNTFYCSFVSINYIVCECGKTFPSEDEEALRLHLEKEHPRRTDNKQYKCGKCGRVFPTQRQCVQHHRKTHLMKLVRVKQGDAPAVKVKNLYSVKKPIEKNIVCEVCGKKYASNAALRYHQRVHTGERPYQCPYCPKTFPMPLNFQIHVRTHTGEKPYKCPDCPKAFGNKAALLRHERVHTGEKPYECPKCGKAFTQSNSMKLHVHTVHLKLPAPYKSKRRKAAAAMKVKGVKDEVMNNEQVWIKSELDGQEVYYELEPKPDVEEVESIVNQDGEEVTEEILYDEGKEQEVFYDDEKLAVLYEVVYNQE